MGRIIVGATGKDLMDEEKQGDVTVDLYAAFDMETEAVAERSSELENSQPLGLLMGFLEVGDWGGEWLFLLVYPIRGSCVQAVLIGIPHKEAVFKTHPMNFLNERTLKGTFFGNYKPRSDIPSVVEKYMNKEFELEKFITHTLPIF
ncbi:hypothetical protein AABB24_038478 [Solanum stoloniferum]|uniref:alcohol dehydrogenase n=1 Tax=Solanum stoloniferum TaxID=62892 RepID=A0ABD2QYT3_9SOLN